MMTMIILICIAAYLAIGGYTAIRTAPGRYQRSLARQDREYPSLDNRGDARMMAHAGSFAYLVGWPIAFPVQTFMGAVSKSIDDNDPAELKRRSVEQRRRIAELELELGIRRSE